MHRDADAIAAQWRESARQKLGARFAGLVARGQEIGKVEAEVVERGNVAALVLWGGQGKGGLEEKIQILDAVLCGLWSLGEPGGRYARLVRRFEKWVVRAEEVWEMRKGGDLDMLLSKGNEGERQELASLLVGELDAQWKDECAGLIRRLDEWQSGIQKLELGRPPAKEGEEAAASSLARIVAACRSLLDDMLAELDVMGCMEREAVAEEIRWVKVVNRRADGNSDERPRAGAIWRGL